MDLKDYDKLKAKKNKKDFEGRNKGLSKWLFRVSFIGNIGSIFFAYFFIFPALLKAISVHLLTGFWGLSIALVTTVLILTIFEIIKRYVIKIFSLDYFDNNKKFTPAITGKLSTTLIIIGISFYIAISGSMNLATTSGKINADIENVNYSKIDSLTKFYENKKTSYINDNNKLREINNELRSKLIETPITYSNIRSGYQKNIDNNIDVIKNNDLSIKNIDNELKNVITNLNLTSNTQKEENKDKDVGLIVLFMILTICDEILIIWGIYFREYYEHKLLEINHQRFEKVYQRKDRYNALLAFIYRDGNANPGDKVISGLELKELVADKANIPNSNKLVDEFLKDMDNLGVFITNGKRRHISLTYNEAKVVIDKFDDVYRILENMR
jgi:hypothetical protein